MPHGRAGLRHRQHWPPGSDLRASRRALKAPHPPSSHLLAPRCRGGQQGPYGTRAPFSLRASPLEMSVRPISLWCIPTLLLLSGVESLRFGWGRSSAPRHPRPRWPPRRVIRPCPSANHAARYTHVQYIAGQPSSGMTYRAPVASWVWYARPQKSTDAAVCALAVIRRTAVRGQPHRACSAVAVWASALSKSDRQLTTR